MASNTAPKRDCEKVAPTKEKQLGGVTGKGFMPGQSGNPASRKPGSRNRLEESFLSDMVAAWAEHGKEAIARVIKDDPSEFLRLCICFAAQRGPWPRPVPRAVMPQLRRLPRARRRSQVPVSISSKSRNLGAREPYLFRIQMLAYLYPPAGSVPAQKSI